MGRVCPHLGKKAKYQIPLGKLKLPDIKWGISGEISAPSSQRFPHEFTDHEICTEEGFKQKSSAQYTLDATGSPSS